MPANTADIELDLRDAMRTVREWPDAAREGAEQAVRQLSVLAEAYYKAEAPEGSGTDVHMRDTVTTIFGRGGMRSRTVAQKRVGSGMRLADLVTGNIDPNWTWDDPPPIPPLADWAAAKTGDPGFAYYLRWKLVEEGYDHDRFVDRAFREYQTGVDIEGIAGRQLQDALSGVV